MIHLKTRCSQTSGCSVFCILNSWFDKAVFPLHLHVSYQVFHYVLEAPGSVQREMHTFSSLQPWLGLEPHLATRLNLIEILLDLWIYCRLKLACSVSFWVLQSLPMDILQNFSLIHMFSVDNSHIIANGKPVLPIIMTCTTRIWFSTNVHDHYFKHTLRKNRWLWCFRYSPAYIFYTRKFMNLSKLSLLHHILLSCPPTWSLDSQM